MVGGQEIIVTVCIGVALGGQGREAEVLIDQASAALFQAKRNGRSRVEQFGDGNEQLHDDQVFRHRALHLALENGDIQVHYQPIITLGDRRIVGAEALARWSSAQYGQVPPSEFIPLTERTGLIDALGRFVVGRACSDMANPEMTRRMIGIAVNVSALQLRAPGFPDEIAAVIEGAGMEPGRLTLELTESVAMGDVERISDQLNLLKSAGARLSIDDFGTGFSSVRILRHLPFDTLKIDREFVSGICDDPHDRAIVAAMIALGSALGMSIVAEGVEMESQHELLRELGCDMAQGYLYYRPMDIASFIGALSD